MTEEKLLQILVEANVLQALNLAEVIRTKITTVQGLEAMIEAGELEAAVRDFIAEHPWLISAMWETFKSERTVAKLIKDAAGEAGLDKDDDFAGRVDLALSSGNQLLILEFKRPV